MFVHYMDPHDPYFVHPVRRRGVRARRESRTRRRRVAEKYRRLYDGEIAYLDDASRPAVRRT